MKKQDETKADQQQERSSKSAKDAPNGDENGSGISGFKVSRRGLIGGALAGTAMGVVGLSSLPEISFADKGSDSEVPPGKLDGYYGFWSGGQSGEIRVLGVPSMRELKRIPVYNFDCTTGHGLTDRSKEMMSGLKCGDTHHVHLSYDNGTYDGKYIYVNDKLNGRLARVRIDYLETDSIVNLPHCQGTHGIFPMRIRRPGKPYLVFCNSEFRNPLPNEGQDLHDPKKYGALHTAVDGETMDVLWQVRVSGNMDLCATDYKGLFSMATCYNSEEAVTLAEMTKADRDWAVFFNVEKIEEAIRNKAFSYIGKSKVPVLDGRKGTPGAGKYTLYVPVPKSPHGINVDPTGRYAICSGKLSPTCTVIDLEKVKQAFAGEIKPEDCIVAEPEVGLGPLHTVFDGKGNAYTSIFIDSVITKWNIAESIKQYAGDKKAKPIVEKIDVHYQVGHTNASMSETKEADGKWLVALCKFSKDRFLPVGPRRSDNDQLIDISGDKMKLVHDGSVHPEPHDAVIVRRDIIQSKTKKVYDPNDPMFDSYRKMAKKDGVDLGKENKVVRKGKNVTVYMTSAAPNFGLTEFKVKKGDMVKVVITNLDQVEDLSHAFTLGGGYDINFGIHAGETNSVTFKVDRRGVYWYYCSWFCHALHLEMRGRMIVEG